MQEDAVRLIDIGFRNDQAIREVHRCGDSRSVHHVTNDFVAIRSTKITATEHLPTKPQVAHKHLFMGQRACHSAGYRNQGFAGAQAIRFLGETFSWVYGRRV